MAVNDEAISDHRFYEKAYGTSSLNFITPVRLMLFRARVGLDSGVGGWRIAVSGLAVVVPFGILVLVDGGILVEDSIGLFFCAFSCEMALITCIALLASIWTTGSMSLWSPTKAATNIVDVMIAVPISEDINDGRREGSNSGYWDSCSLDAI